MTVGVAPTVETICNVTGPVPAPASTVFVESALPVCAVFKVPHVGAEVLAPLALTVATKSFLSRFLGRCLLGAGRERNSQNPPWQPTLRPCRRSQHRRSEIHADSHAKVSQPATEAAILSLAVFYVAWPHQVRSPCRLRRQLQRTLEAAERAAVGKLQAPVLQPQTLEATRRSRHWTAYLVLATTGLRRDEALGLRWSDLDFDRAPAATSIRQTVIAVKHTSMLGTPKTKKGRRSVELDTGTVAALWEHR